ncbi:MAG: Na(+)-translocating NADH:ubiquinone reductase subunit C, partial [Bacteroidaceae bacterium]|nr:Na(+)-translocating NADH:ubiquinone reductase subunit C [Bacteroidaceae bacterium]
MATKEFKCKVCGYVHKGDKAPDICPVCKAGASEFEAVKKGLDTNSNIYTVVYATVMVVIVAFLLVFVSDSLKERQQANIIQDTYKQILYSLNIREMGNVAETYKSTIEGDYLMNADGSLKQLSDDEFCTKYKSEFKSGRLHIFKANVDGAVKYIIPVNGLGLWGEIWGYVALNEDRNTIYGTYFSHASETPGLGGEVGTQYFQER